MSSSGLPEHPPRLRPPPARTKPIIVASERELREIRRSRMSI
jgi:hypothetical protein